jgi:hypothetical protein
LVQVAQENQVLTQRPAQTVQCHALVLFIPLVAQAVGLSQEQD